MHPICLPKIYTRHSWLVTGERKYATAPVDKGKFPLPQKKKNAKPSPKILGYKIHFSPLSFLLKATSYVKIFLHSDLLLTATSFVKILLHSALLLTATPSH